MLPAKHAASLVRFAGPFFVVLAIAIVGIDWYLPEGPAEAGGVQIALFWLLWLPLLITGGTLAAVVCHRVFILGDESMLGQILVWWSFREIRFFGWGIAIGICAGLIAVPLDIILGVTIASMMPSVDQESSLVWIVDSGLLGNLVAAFFVGRWSLVLPATAVDSRPNLSWAWSISRGNALRLMVLVGLLPIGANFVTNFLPEPKSVGFSLFYIAVWGYVWAAEIALLSLSYRELVGYQITDVEDE